MKKNFKKSTLILILAITLLPTTTKPVVGGVGETVLLTKISTILTGMASAESIMQSEILKDIAEGRDALKNLKNTFEKYYNYVKGSKEILNFYNNVYDIYETSLQLVESIKKNEDNLLMIEEIEYFVNLIDFVLLEIKDESTINHSKWKFKKNNLRKTIDNLVKAFEDKNATYMDIMNSLRDVNGRLMVINRRLYLIAKAHRYTISKRRFDLGLYDMGIYRDFVLNKYLTHRWIIDNLSTKAILRKTK